MRGAKRLPAWCIVIAGMVHSDYMHGCIVETGMARKGHPPKKGHKTNHRVSGTALVHEDTLASQTRQAIIHLS